MKSRGGTCGVDPQVDVRASQSKNGCCLPHYTRDALSPVGTGDAFEEE